MTLLPSRGVGDRLKRVGLALLVAVVAVNVWTGSPLFALWVGARFQGSGPPKMASVFVVVAVLAVLSLTMLKLLAVLNAAYEQASGHTASVRTHAPWLRSMRGERVNYPGERPRLTVVERVVIVVVVIALLVFEIWFFFFSSSPIDQRSGRSAVPPDVAPAVAAAPPPRSWRPDRSAG